MTIETRMRCPRRLWVRGEDRMCGQTIGLITWTDTTGVLRGACTSHVGGMKRRYPETLPERVAEHGTLGLSTPWARGAFAPADAIEVENLIPSGYTIGVVGDAHGRSRTFTLWALAPDGEELLRWERRHDPVPAAKQMALALRTEVEPVWPQEVDDATR